MFLLDVYRPKQISDLVFNKDILDQLVYLATNNDIPHLIIAGPAGAGKKTLLKFFLESLYDTDVNLIGKVKYTVHGSSTKKEIEIMQSNYHIVIEPTSTNSDKYMLQDIIKQYATNKSFDFFKTNRHFKIIVITNIENLAINSQAALRRTMEKYAKTCRFVMLCNNLSKIFDPLKSRCRIFSVPLPTSKEIQNIIEQIAIVENINLSNTDCQVILKNSNNQLVKAIWMLDCYRLNSHYLINVDEVFDSLVYLITHVQTTDKLVKIFNRDIRTKVYDILITNIKGSAIITLLMDKLIETISNDQLNARIIKHASVAEYNLIHGRRHIIHIDYFIIAVMNEVMKANYA